MVQLTSNGSPGEVPATVAKGPLNKVPEGTQQSPQETNVQTTQKTTQTLLYNTKQQPSPLEPSPTTATVHPDSTTTLYNQVPGYHNTGGGKIRVKGAKRVKKKGQKNRVTADTRVRPEQGDDSGQPAASPAAPLTPDPLHLSEGSASAGGVQAGGACSGGLGCSANGKSFFLCGTSGWISMGE